MIRPFAAAAIAGFAGATIIFDLRAHKIDWPMAEARGAQARAIGIRSRGLRRGLGYG